MTVSQHAENIGNCGFITSVGVSAALIFDGIVKVLDAHSWIVGAVIGSISLLMQWHFKRKAMKVIMAGGDRRSTLMTRAFDD
ncbi:MAG: hypothetical protein M0R47_16685 [Methylobacter sp.]|uniref:hypothetical protein n=1 Tax=Methylobacter sp. TaxID=2051955 RepID=UPI0025E20399|nr:hypothetical protein [Methylobacter sp.]MCK9622159.1 hypothetical protein [Methylobacter sp.]